MATLDQLPPDRRAIIELVLQRGQSYEDLSGTLDMPESHVREHAREALVSLAPRTADRVDPQWRGQVADYVLGQQSGPQSKATRSHLKGSEAARTWALSVLDSVGHLYPGGAAPTIPAGGRSSEDGEPRTGRPARRAGAAGAAAPAGAGAGGAAAADGDDERPTRPSRRSDRETGESGGARGTGTIAPLSAEARRLVRRRRAIAGAAGLILVVVAVLLATGVFAGGEDEPADAGEETADPAAADPQVTAQVQLQPVGNAEGDGAAIIAEREGQNVLLTQGRLPAPGQGEQYVIWLYNSPEDSVAVATPQIDQRGSFQAVAPLPEEYQDYEAVDVSLQRRSVRSDRRNHSGTSLLRGPIAVAEGGGVPLPEGAAPPEGGVVPEGAVPPEGGVAPEGAVPPGGELPDPGSLPTVPEGG